MAGEIPGKESEGRLSSCLAGWKKCLIRLLKSIVSHPWGVGWDIRRSTIYERDDTRTSERNQFLFGLNDFLRLTAELQEEIGYLAGLGSRAENVGRIAPHSR